MQKLISEDDRELDVLWRARFGEPMPILGAGDIVRHILGLPREAPRAVEPA